MLPNDAVDLLSTLTPGQPMDIIEEILNCIFFDLTSTWRRFVHIGESVCTTWGVGNVSVTPIACFHTPPTRETVPKHKRATDLHQSAKCYRPDPWLTHQSPNIKAFIIGECKGKLQRMMCENSHTICTYSQRNGIIEQSIPCGCNRIT